MSADPMEAAARAMFEEGREAVEERNAAINAAQQERVPDCEFVPLPTWEELDGTPLGDGYLATARLAVVAFLDAATEDNAVLDHITNGDAPEVYRGKLRVTLAALRAVASGEEAGTE